MKKLYSVIALLIIASLALSACGSGIPEPKAEDQIDTLIEWPITCNPQTGRCYQKVYQMGSNRAPEGSMPKMWMDYELIEVAPISESETNLNISEFGILPGEQVYVLVLPESWSNESGSNVNSSDVVSAMALAVPNPTICRAMAIHLIGRVAKDGLTWGAVIAMTNAVADGIVSPSVIKQNADGQIAMQFVVNGVKWLILYGGTNPPTAIGPVLGNTLGRITGAFKSTLQVGQGKAVPLFGEIVALMNCVRRNWPKDPGEADQAKKEHNNLYSAREQESIPADFPMPFPTSFLNGEQGVTYVTVHSGDYTGMLNASLNTLIGLGIIIVVVDGIPFDDPLAVTFTLKWANEGFAFAH